MVIKANTWSSKQKRMGIASASLNPVILTADQVTVKHLGTAHDQKRHGSRYGIAGVRELAKKGGLRVRQTKDGQIAITGPAGGSGGLFGTDARYRNITQAKKFIRERIKKNRVMTTEAQARKRGELTKGDILDPKGKREFRSRVVRKTKAGYFVRGAFAKPGQAAYNLTFVPKADAKFVMNGSQASDMSDYNLMHLTVKETSSFTVFKDTAGDYRWVLQSSNAFRDRDGEIVSTKALEADVERSEKESPGNYGPLRWWHISDPLPLDIGACDWRVVHGRTLIESGTFKSEAIGAAIKEAAPDLQVSIGFNHPKDQPDPNGVFTTIRVFERSLLPTGKAANSFTRVFVKGDEMATKEEKLAALKLLGIDPQSILSQAEATEKELDAQSVAFKGEGESNKAKKKPMPMPDPEEDEDEDEDEDEEDKKDLDEEPVIGNMSVKEYAEMLTRALAPLAAHVQSGAKEATDAQVRAEKETQERAEMKEILSKQEQFLAAQVKAVEAQAHTVKELQSRLAELEGSAPRAVKGYRASEDPSTEIGEAELARMKESGKLPSADPVVTDFLGGFLGITG